MRYAGGVGYLDGGGLTAAERARRERVRLAVAELIEAGPGCCCGDARMLLRRRGMGRT